MTSPPPFDGDKIARFRIHLINGMTLQRDVAMGCYRDVLEGKIGWLACQDATTVNASKITHLECLGGVS